MKYKAPDKPIISNFETVQLSVSAKFTEDEEKTDN